MQTRKSQRRYFLNDIPPEEAVGRLFSGLEETGALDRMPAEEVPLDRALGRVTAAPVWARNSSPHYHAAAMDGVAVRAAETVGATETSPVSVKVGEQAVWADTGAPTPPGLDSVIMLESCRRRMRPP